MFIKEEELFLHRKNKKERLPISVIGKFSSSLETGRNMSYQVRNGGEGRLVNLGSTLGCLPFLHGRWWVRTKITEPTKPAELLGEGLSLKWLPQIGIGG